MSTETPSPVSDESVSTEGTVLREFVDQAIAQKRLATMSPRSALLSQSSLQTPTADEPSAMTANGVVDSGRHARKRSSADSRRKRGGMEVARPSALSQLMDVDLSRKDPTDEVMRLREILKTVERHSISEARRAKELERANQETERRLHMLAETRLLEQKETMKAQQEVRLVQLQLQNAQDEIERKQREMQRIERQRDEAAAEAARERERARRFHEQTIAAAAREEGRRRGFQAGFDYARQERRIAATTRKSINAANTRRITAPRPSTVESNSTRTDKGKQRAREEEPVESDDVYFPRPSRSRPRSQSQSQFQFQSQSQPQPPPQAPSFASHSRATRAMNNDNDMSPSQLPLRGLPPLDNYPEERPSRPGPSHSTPHAPYVPPPDSDSETEGFIARPTMPPPNLPSAPNRPSPNRPQPSRPQPNQPQSNQFPPNQPPLNRPPQNQPPPNRPPSRMKTPAISIFEIDIPPAEQLNRQYNYSQESGSDTMPQIPREQWVTASSYNQIRGPPIQPSPQYLQRPTQTPTKTVKFPKILTRPSLAKTREQASSWYRSLSFRKKNKPVIDPITEETTTPVSAGPLTGTTITESQPPTATDPPETAESQEIYGGSGQPPASWYQPKQPSVPPSAPVSTRSGYSRMRPISEASTRVSQFDLLSTPHLVAAPAMSVRSGKEGPRRMKEKDSLLSVIKEDPASRGNTPERYVPGANSSGPRASAENMRSMSSVLSQPNFGQGTLQQQSSFGTFDSSTQNKRRSRRPPPSIEVPDPDQELEPFGVAYNRAAVANGYQTYHGSNLTRRPSRISEKTTPDTSIVIDVVPPSGIIPEASQSPPHTGRNHLSPYHTYQPAAPSFKQSIQSLRSQGQSSTRREAPPVERPSSAAESSRRQSKRNSNGYAEPAQNPYQPSPSMSNAQPRPPSASSRRASVNNNPYGSSNPTYSYTAVDQSRSPGHASQHQARPESLRPESVRSSSSKKPVQVHPYSSQTSLNNITNTGSVMGQPKNASSSRLVLATPIHRVASNASMRSQGSYSKYDPTEYVDPAFWSADGPPEPPPPPAKEAKTESYFDIPTRPSSAHSGLSYMSIPHT